MRCAAIIGCVAWSVRFLGCDTTMTRSAFVDTDGDGISDTDELRIHGTSPVLADTDGDGMSDYEEIVLHTFNPETTPLRFNPRVADVPLMNVQIVGPPLISLRLIATDGETWTYETSRSFEQIFTVTASVTESDSFSSTVSASDTISKDVSMQFSDNSLAINEEAEKAEKAEKAEEAEKAKEVDGPAVANEEPPPFDPGGPDVVILTTGVSSTINWSNTVGVTLSFTAEQSRQWREAVTFAQAYAASHQISATGALLEVLAKFENRGNMPFRLTNIILSASMVGPDGVEVPVGNLDINTLFSVLLPYSIAPGGVQGPINFSRDNLTLEQFADLVDNMEGLKVRVGVYELVDSLGKPYVFDAATVISRTATVVIDYGGQRPRERFLVATNLDPARPEVKMDRVLSEILRLPYEADSERGLTSVRNISTPEAGRWTVEVRHNDKGDLVTTAYQPPYELSDITLRAGDVIRLTWSVP